MAKTVGRVHTHTQDSLNKIIKMNKANKYKLNWWKDNKTSINYNARATADLLNTTAWTAKFGDSSKGIEAIGSSTLEMWVASWNEKGYTQLYVDNYNLDGYYVGTTSKPTSTIQSVLNDTAGYADTLYFPHTSKVSNCSGYWLASPSANVIDNIVGIECGGEVSYCYSMSAVSVVLRSTPSNFNSESFSNDRCIRKFSSSTVIAENVLYIKLKNSRQGVKNKKRIFSGI